MPKITTPETPADLSRAFIAAIIAAAQDTQCQCKTCQIMRKAASEYLKVLEV